MQRTVKILCAAAALAVDAGMAYAAITQAPTMPAQVRITPLEAYAGTDGFVFEALGSAREEGLSWVADVVEVAPDRFVLDPSAGLRAIWRGKVDHSRAITWQGFSFEFKIPPSSQGGLGLSSVRADSQVADIARQRSSFAYLAGPILDEWVPHDPLPEGQSLLWVMGPALLERVAYENYGSGVAVGPVAFARVEVLTVPEPATCALMGVGLLAMCLTRRQR